MAEQTYECINLNEDSWIHTLPFKCEEFVPFNELWQIHPEEYNDIMMMGKLIKTPRWQQTYGRSYNFSGVNHVALDIPDIILPYLHFVNNLGYGEFNQILINWYENGLHYIGSHSDDTTQLKKNSPIISISIGAERIFRFRSKITKKTVLDISLSDGIIVVMGGECQKDFKHEIPKITGEKALKIKPRINFTFRQFKDS